MDGSEQGGPGLVIEGDDHRCCWKVTDVIGFAFTSVDMQSLKISACCKEILVFTCHYCKKQMENLHCT